MREFKNNTEVKIRLPKHIKDAFKNMCDEELIDMSVRIRQIIMKELKEKGYATKNTTERTGSDSEV